MNTRILTSKTEHNLRRSLGSVTDHGPSAALAKRTVRWRALIWLASVALLLCGTALPVRAHQSPPNCTGSGLGISLFTDVPDAQVGDTIRYSALVFNTPFPACDATEIVAGIVTPDGVTNMITLTRTALVPGDSDNYLNVVSYVVRAQDILPDGTVRATAFDNGDIHQND